MNVDRWLVFEPLDTVAVRDGRSFDAGVQSVAKAVVPSPATVAGAVGAAYGADPGAGTNSTERGRTVPREIRGPLPMEWDDGRWSPWFPQPCDVVRDSVTKQVSRLASPDKSEFGDVATDLDDGDPDDIRLLSGDGEAQPGWWVLSQLRRYLRNEQVENAVGSPDPWLVEHRVGLARDEYRTARDGMLYAVEHLRPRRRLGFAVLCVDTPSGKPAGTVFLGGEGRRAAVHTPATDAISGFPDPPGSSPGGSPGDFPHGKLLLYLATPAVFAAGWRPSEQDLRGGRLVAAATGPPQVISTARPDRRTGGFGHARTLWAVPAGSVYYLEFPTGQEAAKAAAAWHGTALPQKDETLRTAGFGLALTGRW
ncbi:MAG TPA: type III-B CRISPR module-associated Cmr3 family protein [Micromonosporaceae bacterium]|nr:type III-B CRISPR module-associated Cmr3 family protein [Micromonosporaceae bacterium]